MRLLRLLSLAVAIVSLGPTARAQGPQTAQAKKEKESKTTKATFMVTGLHCPPCTKTVESSLSKAKGIRTIKVDWKTKLAHVEFDEKTVPAQQVAQILAATPHMMGRDMHYGGWLTLKAPEIKDDASAKRAQQALAKVEGVDRVATYPAQHTLGVSFGKKGKVTTSDLIARLKDAGYSATPL